MTIPGRSLWPAAVLLLCGSATADPMLDAADALCEKVKACSMAQVSGAEMTEEMRQMMEPMLEGMCANMRSSVQDVPDGHALYQPGIDCMNSIAALSCEKMQEADATPACQEYEKLATELSGE